LADREAAVAKQAACAAIPGPAGPILRIVEKGCALSPPFPVLWNGEKIEVKTGRQSAVCIGSCIHVATPLTLYRMKRDTEYAMTVRTRKS
jgi:hypothetical protein